MNDMDLVQDLVPDARLPGVDRLAPARARLMAAAVTARAAGHTPARSGRRRLRYAIGGGISAAVAASVAAALLIASGGPGAPAPTGQSPGTATSALTPQLILAKAVTAANARPDLVPRPDQFAYVKTVRSGNGAIGTTQIWNSVGGLHEGRLLRPDVMTHQVTPAVVPRCVNGKVLNHMLPCDYPLGYDPALPTQPAAAVEYLGSPQAETADHRLAAMGAFTYRSVYTYLSPAQMVAVFRGFGALPGIQTVPDAVDGAGRHGIGLSWPLNDGYSIVLVFDKTTYDFLGYVDYDNTAAHRPFAAVAILTMTLVDRVGQTG